MLHTYSKTTFAVLALLSSVKAERRDIEDASICSRRGENFTQGYGTYFNDYLHYNIIASYVKGDDIKEDADALRFAQNDVENAILDLQIYNKWTDGAVEA